MKIHWIIILLFISFLLIYSGAWLLGILVVALVLACVLWNPLKDDLNQEYKAMEDAKPSSPKRKDLEEMLEDAGNVLVKNEGKSKEPIKAFSKGSEEFVERIKKFTK
jgi:hypothetical protein